jgi:NADH-quinone oxidoreductase subunit G
VDRARLNTVRGPTDADAGWDQALSTISTALETCRAASPDGPAADKKMEPKRVGSPIGVIASAQLTNEELYLIREIFQRALGAQVTASVPDQPGSSDDFLIKADKNPNTRGATLLGFAGPDAADAGQLVDEAVQGNMEVLWVFGHDLVKLFGEAKVRELAARVPLFIYSGTNENPTVPWAHWALPTAAYVEKDGTFVNCHGRIQRIGRAFPPLAGSREDWRMLLDLARLLGRPFDWRGPEDIFREAAESLGPFEGLSYEAIGAQGAPLST